MSFFVTSVTTRKREINNILVLNVAKNHRDIVFAVADEDEQVELVKKFNLQDSGEDVNVGCRDKERGFDRKTVTKI